MNIRNLFDRQKSLDCYIEEENNLQQEDLFDRKVLALLVEVGELANETRCFKFWSKKGPSEKSVILEEYVDGVHFILSLGIEKKYEQDARIHTAATGGSAMTDQFLKVMACIQQFRQDQTLASYEDLFSHYMLLGEMLGFSEEDIEQAYFNKNEVNYKRQQEGY